MTPYNRVRGKAEGWNLVFQGVTFLPLDAAAPLIHLERNIAELSHKLFPRLTSRELPYKDVLDCIQFAYMRDTKGVYMAQE